MTNQAMMTKKVVAAEVHNSKKSQTYLWARWKISGVSMTLTSIESRTPMSMSMINKY